MGGRDRDDFATAQPQASTTTFPQILLQCRSFYIDLYSSIKDKRGERWGGKGRGWQSPKTHTQIRRTTGLRCVSFFSSFLLFPPNLATVANAKKCIFFISPASKAAPGSGPGKPLCAQDHPRHQLQARRWRSLPKSRVGRL